jgi:hypothetical protein
LIIYYYYFREKKSVFKTKQEYIRNVQRLKKQGINIFFHIQRNSKKIKIDTKRINVNKFKAKSFGIMPSKQTNNDVIAIEELVNEIKQNLRLKAAAPPSTGAAQEHHLHHHPLLQPLTNDYLQQPKQYHSQAQQLITRKQRSRPSPYHIPCRSWSDNSSAQNKKNLQKTRKNDENNIEDPYELLQSLLKNNSLVKEAVRRLQLNSTYSRKQNYFYDSDEDNRSPIVMMCQLES